MSGPHLLVSHNAARSVRGVEMRVMMLVRMFCCHCRSHGASKTDTLQLLAHGLQILGGFGR